MKVKKIRRKIRYTVIYIVLRLVIFISWLIPRNVWVRICGGLGSLAYYLATQSRNLTIRHLTMAFGKTMPADEIRKLAKRVFRMMGKNAGDIIRAVNIKNYESFKRITVANNFHYAEQARQKGNGVIFLTAHIGAFEFSATEVSFRGYQPYIIGASMKDKRLNRLLWSQRSKFGATIVERGKDTFTLIKALKKKGSIGILIDQDTRVKSVFVNFFGVPCATPVGATLLALKTGAAVVPAFCHLRDDLMQEINFYPEVELARTGDEETDIRVNTQRFNDIIEAEIRKFPDQWVWLHERWKTKPGEEIK
ncbi:MAG: lysophospholipid acyltransferase family protein [Cyclobacteriaceae bacterium]|nr:lysophospholipid acyltransferase family protein [Cyclobacteriaceae bacterium]